MPDSRRTYRILTFGFVLLGIGISITAVAWPSISADMGLPIADLGIVTLVYGAGYTAATLSGGWVAERFSSSAILRIGAVGAIVGLAAVALTPSWPVLLIAMFAFGLGGGTEDVATNAYVAVRYGPREMGSIHGVFGVGAIIGPLLVTGLIAIGASWRLSFAVLGVGQLVFLGAVMVWARGISIPTRKSTGDTTKLSLTAPLVWSIGIFLAYAAVAGTTGVWAFTYLTEDRGFSESASGVIVAAFWTAFAVSRFIYGLTNDRYDARLIMRISMVGTILSLLVFWWNPTPAIGVIALIASGFSHGAFFPVQILMTPRRFGPTLAPSIIGYEVGAVNVGNAVIPALVGILVGSIGLQVVPPVLVVSALVLTFTLEMLARTQRGVRATVVEGT
jgi:fucose permease